VALHDSSLDAALDREGATMPAPLSAIGASETGRLILVAEDNEINQDVIRSQLALMGFAAEIAATGLEALDRWRSGTYSMLLTDLNMPEMDGYELAATIRKETSGARIPIVALTANASTSEIKRCNDVGIDGYMTKPVPLADLHAMLQKWMPAAAQPLPLRQPKASPAPWHPGRSTKPPTPIAPVDLAVLRALVGSDPETIRDVVESFRTSAALSRDAIRIGVGLGECKVVADAVHKLKSAARALGSFRLGAICEEMETAANARRQSELVAQLESFEQEYDEVHCFLDAS
jgi:CheY-like chemotaxis protein/HPt (histidine-containing phosphotransfer) domain-containing protein